MEYSKFVRAVLLGLPFFLWGTNMVVMEDVMPMTGAMFVAFARLLPSGALIIYFARYVKTRAILGTVPCRLKSACT
jgi:hypothetical protein